MLVPGRPSQSPYIHPASGITANRRIHIALRRDNGPPRNLCARRTVDAALQIYLSLDEERGAFSTFIFDDLGLMAASSIFPMQCYGLALPYLRST